MIQVLSEHTTQYMFDYGENKESFVIHQDEIETIILPFIDFFVFKNRYIL